MKTSKTSAFTLIELLIVIVIIAILVSLAYPSLTSMQRRAKDAQCVGNLRNSAAALQLGAIDNGNKIVVSSSGAGNIDYLPYSIVLGDDDDDLSTMSCPLAPKPISLELNSYGINFNDFPEIGAEWKDVTVVDDEGEDVEVSSLNLATITQPANMILLADSCNSNGYQSYGIGIAGADIGFWHKNKANAAFIDGSVRGLMFDELQNHSQAGAYLIEDGNVQRKSVPAYEAP